MSKGEERATIFFQTAIATGCLTESLTRLASLHRVTVSVVVCGGIGVIALGILIINSLLEGGQY